MLRSFISHSLSTRIRRTLAAVTMTVLIMIVTVTSALAYYPGQRTGMYIRFSLDNIVQYAELDVTYWKNTGKQGVSMCPELAGQNQDWMYVRGCADH